MTHEALAVERQGSRYLPLVDLHYLSREIVQTEQRQWKLQGNVARWEAEDYLEDLRDWHWDWVRGSIPIRLHRCVDCQRVQQTPAGISYCLRCAPAP